jgi:hypothetical protein
MARFALITLLTALLGWTLAAHAAFERDYPNLLYNGSYEQVEWYAGREAEFWQLRPNMTRVTDVAHSGKAALKITGPANNYTFQRDVALLPNTRYSLSMWVKLANVNAKGVSVEYGQLIPKTAGQLGATKQVNGTLDWTKVEVEFTTPTDHENGWLRLVWNLGEGETAWIDDVALAPVDGKVPPMKVPAMMPLGGTFEGPTFVTLSSDIPGAVLRYTVDGSDPTPFSVVYNAPFRITGPVTVKARAFHAGHNDNAAIAKAAFTLKPKIGEGVPFYPVGWNQDVEDWWAGHIYNPASKTALKSAIVSPKPIINVAEVHAKHPESVTAGIEEALDMLPEQGGTLYFPKAHGTYSITKPPVTAMNYYTIAGPILVMRRSNIHFISDGATIRYDGPEWTITAPSGNVAGILNFCSMDTADNKAMQRASTNFYFKGLTFDGGGKTPGGLVFRHCAEVLMDDCTFTNYDLKAKGHPGAINAASVTDGIWVRNCHFDNALFGIYWDGVHNAGVINSTFGPGLVRSDVLMFTNNDMAPLSAYQRTCQYIVLANNAFQGPGQTAISMTNANTLVTGNTVTGKYTTFVSQIGRGCSNITHFLRYDGSGIKVIGNTVEEARTLVSFTRDVSQTTRKEIFTMRNVVKDNTARSIDTLVEFIPERANDPNWNFGDPEYSRIDDVTITGNTVSGTMRPVIRLDHEAVTRITRINIFGNTLTGKTRDLLLDRRSRPLAEAPGVTVGENTLNE